MAINRAIGGVMMGAGVFMASEAKEKRKREVAMASQNEKIISDVENAEDKFNRLSRHLDKINYKESLKIEKDAAKKRIFKSVLKGAAAAGAAFIVGRVLTELGVTDWLGEKAEHIGEKVKNSASAIFGNHNPEIFSGPENLPMPEAPPMAGEAMEKIASIELVAENGSSVQGEIIDFVKDHQAQIYDHHPELRKFNPGQIAHRMYIDFLHHHPNPLNKSLDMVYAGAKIEINPASLEIVNIDDAKGTIARAIHQVAPGHEQWAGMKNLTVQDLDGKFQDKIAKLSAEYTNHWGLEAKIKASEKIKDWVARIAKVAIARN